MVIAGEKCPRIVPAPAAAPYPLPMNAPLFPISPLLPQIQQHLAVQPRLVLEAPDLDRAAEELPEELDLDELPEL